MTTQEMRLVDLYPSVVIRRGFPTQRSRSVGDVGVLSVPALHAGATPKHFAQREDLADLRMDLARPGDVLVAIEGESIGEALMVPADAGDFVPSQQVATLRVADSAVLDPWYLGAWFATDSTRQKLRRLTRRSGIQRISVKDLATVILPVPSLQTQHSIGERFRAFDTSIQSHRAVTSCLEELRAVDLAVVFASVDSSEIVNQGSQG